MNLGHALVSSCVQFVWPAHCAGCNVILHTDRTIFCGPCAQSINPIAGACAGCALPRIWPQLAVPGVACPVCARLQFAFSSAFAGFEYGEAIASAIMRMKHGGHPDLARRLGRIFQDTVSRAMDVGGALPVDVVLPVPLHPRKLKHRGFNQALELARVVLGRIRARSPSDTVLPVLERQLLLRVKETRELGRSGPAARQEEVFEAFGVGDPARIVGRRFLVVDDVMTTGATLNECAETLLRAGAQEVRVAALARALI
jgi:ComF family protein